MKLRSLLLPFLLLTAGVVIGATMTTPPKSSLKLGAFSVSLSVKDIATSRAFYEKLGFSPVMGGAGERWLILRNGETTLGLFQGLFPRNMLTFNPGWDSQNQPLKEFQDVRELQRALKAQGVKFDSEADEKTKGPASFLVTDPDGNPILFDQHV